MSRRSRTARSQESRTPCSSAGRSHRGGFWPAAMHLYRPLMRPSTSKSIATGLLAIAALAGSACAGEDDQRPRPSSDASASAAMAPAGRDSKHERQPHGVIVPRVRGLRVREAEPLLRSVGLRAAVRAVSSSRREATSRPSGIVLSQRPAPGVRARRGSDVVLSVAPARSTARLAPPSVQPGLPTPSTAPRRVGRPPQQGGDVPAGRETTSSERPPQLRAQE